MRRGHGDRANEQMRGQIGQPKPTEASEKEDEMVPPRHEAEECHVQERHTADTTMITVPFSPPFLAGTPIIFGGQA